jgi:hypothetical protein
MLPSASAAAAGRSPVAADTSTQTKNAISPNDRTGDPGWLLETAVPDCINRDPEACIARPA